MAASAFGAELAQILRKSSGLVSSLLQVLQNAKPSVASVPVSSRQIAHPEVTFVYEESVTPRFTRFLTLPIPLCRNTSYEVQQSLHSSGEERGCCGGKSAL